jgi:hypothetical protein
MFSSLTDSTEYNTWLKGLEIIIGSFSITGSSLIILIFFTNLNKITSAFELILQLSISSLINTISYLILFIPKEDSSYDKITCKIQGLLMLFSELSVNMISTSMSFYIWRSKAEFNTHDNFSCKSRSIYLAFNYILPLVFSLMCVEYIGQNGRWCWISAEYADSLGLTEYIGIWFLIFLNLCFAYMISNITTDENYLHAEVKKNRKEYIQKLIRYPIISLCCWLPATINRFICIVDNDNRSWTIQYFFQILHISLNLIQGFLYALVSLSNLNSDGNFKIILKSCVSFFSCCKKNKYRKEISHNDLSQYLSNSDNKVSDNSKNNSFYHEISSDSVRIPNLNRET